MPLYSFVNKETGDTTKEWMSYTELDAYLEANPHLEQTICAPIQMDTHKLGRMKPPEGFREVLRNVAKQNPGNKINTF
jgi:hypothetical protein